MDDLVSVSSFSFYVFTFKNVERRMDLNIRIDFDFLPLFSVIRVALGCIFSECLLRYFIFGATKHPHLIPIACIHRLLYKTAGPLNCTTWGTGVGSHNLGPM